MQFSLFNIICSLRSGFDIPMRIKRRHFSELYSPKVTYRVDLLPLLPVVIFRKFSVMNFLCYFQCYHFKRRAIVSGRLQDDCIWQKMECKWTASWGKRTLITLMSWNFDTTKMVLYEKETFQLFLSSKSIFWEEMPLFITLKSCIGF